MLFVVRSLENCAGDQLEKSSVVQAVLPCESECLGKRLNRERDHHVACELRHIGLFRICTERPRFLSERIEQRLRLLKGARITRCHDVQFASRGHRWYSKYRGSRKGHIRLFMCLLQLVHELG